MSDFRITVVTPSIRPEGLAITQKCLSEQTFKDFEWCVEIGIPEQGHDLNKSYNRMLKRAKGELIVSLQDYIRVGRDYLQKMWDMHIEKPNAFITAPVGKVQNLEFTPPATWDWRAYTEGKHEKWIKGQWDCWEIDSGAAPKEALFKIGG